MSLAQLEEVFRSKKVAYQKDDDKSLRLDAENGNALYPIYYTEEQHGWIQAFMWFPPGDQLVQDCSGLCDELMRRMVSVQVDFNARTGRFWIGTFMRPETAWKETAHFLYACDTLCPLIVRVTQVGKWDTRLVDLAFVRPEHMPQA